MSSVFWGASIGQLRVLLILSWMAMLAHQFEEYGVPGGFPSFTNDFFFGNHENPERFPFNPQQTLLTNVIFWPFYIAAVIWPSAIWLALATVLAALAQAPMHGLIMPIRLKLPYNPGMATSVFLFIPVGVAYIHYVVASHLVTGMDWLWGALGAVAYFIITVGMPARFMHRRDAKYAYTATEMNKPVALAMAARR